MARQRSWLLTLAKVYSEFGVAATRKKSAETFAKVSPSVWFDMSSILWRGADVNSGKLRNDYNLVPACNHDPGKQVASAGAQEIRAPAAKITIPLPE